MFNHVTIAESKTVTVSARSRAPLQEGLLRGSYLIRSVNYEPGGSRKIAD